MTITVNLAYAGFESHVIKRYFDLLHFFTSQSSGHAVTASRYLITSDKKMFGLRKENFQPFISVKNTHFSPKPGVNLA
jgi:hypothetical protein